MSATQSFFYFFGNKLGSQDEIKIKIKLLRTVSIELKSKETLRVSFDFNSIGKKSELILFTVALSYHWGILNQPGCSRKDKTKEKRNITPALYWQESEGHTKILLKKNSYFFDFQKIGSNEK